MSKTLIKIFVVFVLIGAAVAAVPDSAQARYYGGRGWHGGYRGGWGGGWGYPYAYPYPYYQPYYYGGGRCGYARVWRRGYWRRVWRCW